MRGARVRVAGVVVTGRRQLSTPAGYRFVDFARIVATGGMGGQGCVSFQRMRDGKRGRANGGNGGNGGDVVIRASSSLLGLSIQSASVRGQEGMNGGPNLSHGQRGSDTIVRVPRGSVINVLDGGAPGHDWLDLFAGDDGDEERERERPEAADSDSAIDLINDGDEVVIAKGGRGGMGNRTSNMRFKKGVLQVPESGAKGARVRIQIELKTLADIGLVGYPNAGKSTLLSSICAARPKIAAYPFTTLHPNLGVIEFRDLERSRCTVADIPGLIAGAADNRGLGHRFLRHIERTQVILYVVDIAGTEARDPIDDYRQLRSELGLYNHALIQRPALIFANKIDRKPVTCERNLQRLGAEASGVPIVPGSALTRRNIDTLLQTLHTMMPRSNPWS